MDMSYYKKYEPIFGDWKIVRELGSGSFGKVFEIQWEDFGYTYKAALKAITIPQSQSELDSIIAEGMDSQSATSYYRGFVQELVEEFRLMSKLKGESNIVSYEAHKVIQHDDGIGWDILIRMELLTPLPKYVQSHRFEREDIARLGIDICKALELCRKHNIIHRDIKPDNIFVSDNGQFKLGDFGIAKTVEKTMSGLSKKGTYNYMAPEVYKGEEYGPSVDIYSLGILLYRYLNNGRAPFLPPPPTPFGFNDVNAALARRMKGEPLPAPANADEHFAAVVLKACAFDPKERYASATEMRKDLEAVFEELAPAHISTPFGEVSTKYDGTVVLTEEHPETDDATVLLSEAEEGTVSIFSSQGESDIGEYRFSYKKANNADCGRQKATSQSGSGEYSYSFKKANNASSGRQEAAGQRNAGEYRYSFKKAGSNGRNAGEYHFSFKNDSKDPARPFANGRNYDPSRFRKGNIVAISAGFAHTVGLKSDGTVVAVGNNNFGQCNVGSWSDIVAIAAGDFHTVGLRSDGTVVAAGGSSSSGNGQCSVGNWSSIIDVDVGMFHTVGLRSNGTVVTAGENDSGECNVSGWSNIVTVCAGSSNTVGLKSDGTVVAAGTNAFGQCNVGGWTDIVAISASMFHTAGLKADGTVVAVGRNDNGQCDVSGWKNIVAVYTGEAHTVGLRSDGTVVAVGNNSDGRCNINDWKNIVSLSVSESTRTVGLKADGSVVAVGKNIFGQCNVSGWTDIVAVSSNSFHTVGLKKDGTVVAVGKNDDGQCDVSKLR